MKKKKDKKNMSKKVDNKMSKSEKFDKEMVKKYPNLYCQRGLPPTETCMCWGFEIGPGWHGIIRNISAQLDLISKTTGMIIQATQVKEKYGSLRFYISNYFEDSTSISEKEQEIWHKIVDAIVSRAEQESGWTCEECGKFGENKEIYGWYSTLCERHRKAREKEMAKRMEETPDSQKKLLIEKIGMI